MIRVSDLLGQNVISLTDATTKGVVDGVAFERGRVSGLDVGGRYVPASAVRSFDGDTVTIDDDSPFESSATVTEPVDSVSDPETPGTEAIELPPVTDPDAGALPPELAGTTAGSTASGLPAADPASLVEQPTPDRDADEGAEDGADSRRRRRWSGNPIGKLLLDTDGDELGTVADIEIDADGTVVRVLDDRGQHHEELRAAGSYCVVVDS